MIKEYLKRWEENKNKLRRKFESLNEFEIRDLSYEFLVKCIIDEILNNGVCDSEFSSKKLKVIDYGDYQGSMIFIFPKNLYQPGLNDTYYTTMEYGSCAGCDILLKIICDYFEVVNSNKHKDLVDDLMTLCLHLFQNIHSFKAEIHSRREYERTNK